MVEALAVTAPTKRQIGLSELYAGHRGKLVDRWEGYIGPYERNLASLQVKDLLEIGVLNGGSLEIWAQFFPGAQHIIGCDIEPRCASLSFNDPRIHVVVGDASSSDTAASIAAIAPAFDLIIDDGSHTSRDIVLNFCRYWPALRDGGIYVVEDLHCSYWETYGGGLHHPRSSMAFFKALADAINCEHWGNGQSREQLVGEIASCWQVSMSETELMRVHSVEFANSMCFVRKDRSEANHLGRHLFAGEDCPIWTPPAHGKLFAEGDVPDQTANAWSAPGRSSVQLSLANEELLEQNRRLQEELLAVRKTLWWRCGAPFRFLRGLFARN